MNKHATTKNETTERPGGELEIRELTPEELALISGGNRQYGSSVGGTYYGPYDTYDELNDAESASE